MGNKINVLIIDDSSLMRKILSDIISSEPQFKVVDTAKNGREALDKVFSLRPDVITLDVNLPSQDGLAVLEQIMKKQPTRAIMLSAYTQKDAAATIAALELGALDFIPKPSGEVSQDLDTLKDEIISKIKMAAGVDWEKFLSNLRKPAAVKQEVRFKSTKIKKLVVIGASTGGPRAILQILQALPSGIPAAFLIIQHMPKGFTANFAERIAWESRIKAKEAEVGDVILGSQAYIAPAGFHMIVEKIHAEQEDKLKISLNKGPLVNFVCPSVDVTMNSVAEAFGPNVIGVVLTGMGKDGLEGARKIKQRGGFLIVQDEATSVVWGMPRVIVEQHLADSVLPLSEIAHAIIKNLET